jgi:hypothetical protein
MSSLLAVDSLPFDSPRSLRNKDDKKKIFKRLGIGFGKKAWGGSIIKKLRFSRSLALIKTASSPHLQGRFMNPPYTRLANIFLRMGR